MASKLSASRRASVPFPAPAGPSMAMVSGRVIERSPQIERLDGGVSPAAFEAFPLYPNGRRGKPGRSLRRLHAGNQPRMRAQALPGYLEMTMNISARAPNSLQNPGRIIQRKRAARAPTDSGYFEDIPDKQQQDL